MVANIGTSADPASVCGSPGRDGGRGRALVNVNNRLVPENTPLHDGDMVILSRDLLTI